MILQRLSVSEGGGIPRGALPSPLLNTFPEVCRRHMQLWFECLLAEAILEAEGTPLHIESNPGTGWQPVSTS